MNTIRNVLLISGLCFFLLACGGRSLLTSDLSYKDEFQALVGQKLILLSGDRVWFLMRDPYDPFTNFSRGYKLSLITLEHAANLTSGTIKPPLTPKGFYEILGIVDGSKIQIERVHEYGMETATPVALGFIELNPGRRYPFESEWKPIFESQIMRQETEKQ
ncbi:hypothetical protein ACMXYO_14065 [Neptuniibacter sp. QD37_6]|uniref:hypothetical protein n=1 Tax=Neptuniibacter sp. QD37_6 TaxID=3398210 RepID=UPI0039F52630